MNRIEIHGHVFVTGDGGSTIVDPSMLVAVQIARPALQVRHEWTVLAITVTGAAIAVAHRDAPSGQINRADQEWAEDVQRELLEAIAEVRR